MNNWEQLIDAALRDLQNAAEEYKKVLSRYSKLPPVRVRNIRVSEQLIWPGVDRDKRSVQFERLRRPSHTENTNWCWCLECYPICVWDTNRISNIIADDTGRHPRDILRALRRIQAAAAWCRRRAAGLQRAYEEVVRQQTHAAEAIEAEIATRAIAR